MTHTTNAALAADKPKSLLDQLRHYEPAICHDILRVLRMITNDGTLRDYDDELANRIEDAKTLVTLVPAILSALRSPPPVGAEDVRNALARVSEWWNWSGPRPDVPVTDIGVLVNAFETLSRERDAAVRERDGLRVEKRQLMRALSRNTGDA